MSDNLIAGFLKVRNGILRGGNLYRVLHNMYEYCDEVFVCEDASFDGTREYLEKHMLHPENVLHVPLKEHNFSEELMWKQRLIELVHERGPWEYIFWMDDDEVLDARGTAELRDFCRSKLDSKERAWAFHYTQVWRNTSWARTDEGFDAGWFYKLWRYTPDLTFAVEKGTHKMQFPTRVLADITTKRVSKSPFEVIHYGNEGVNLRWKCIQYYGGLGGVERHLVFPDATYRPVDPKIFPEGSELNAGDKPEPFPEETVRKIRVLKDLTKLEKTFCVILPTYNRADTLARALDSLLAQTYGHWICFVLDDGSTDATSELMKQYVEKDPRIFYVRYLDRRGGVAMNEIGMDIAINTAEWWTRLGSDDWFVSNKLEMDARALADHEAVYGPFVVHRVGKFGELGNLPCPSDIVLDGFVKGGFFASWANCAMQSQVLSRVKRKFGTYCDPTLENMEDRLVNFRVAKVVDWVWRGYVGDDFLVNPTMEQCQEILKGPKREDLVPDAVWNVNQIGASANQGVYAKDTGTTTKLIQQEKDI